MISTALRPQSDSIAVTAGRRRRQAVRRLAPLLVAVAALTTLAGLTTNVQTASAASYDWHFRPPGVTVKFNRSETRSIAFGNRLAGYAAVSRFLSGNTFGWLVTYSRGYASYLYYHRNQCLWIYADVTKGANYGGWRC
jgi:hypothetical protein